MFPNPATAFADAVAASTRLLPDGCPEDGAVSVDDEGYVLEIDLPAAADATVDTEWRHSRLTVRATVDGEPVYEETTRFPSVVDGDGITATAREGSLVVRLPVPRSEGSGNAGAGRTGAPAD